MSTNPGINYGPLTNVNLKTGIRFGVISQGEVLQAWCDSSEGVYNHHCPYCGNEISQKIYDKVQSGENKKCKSCKKLLDESDFYDAEPSGFTFNKEGYKVIQFQDDTDLFIELSPYFTYAAYCSPCAPGACNLHEPFKMDIEINDKLTAVMYQLNAEKAGFPKVYCFGHDWFDDEKAPYPVFDVKTGELIEAPKKEESKKCDSCNAMMINGAYCHETGCPVSWKNEKRKCKWCDTVFTPEEKGQVCCCNDCNEAYNG